MRLTYAGRIVTVLLFAALLSSAALQASGSSEIGLLRSGTYIYRGDRPSTGQEWFAVLPDSAASRLERTTIQVSVVSFLCSDSAMKVTTDVSGTPLFLVRGLPTLKEGPIPTVFVGSKFLYPGESVSLNLGEDNWFVLQAYGTAGPRGLFTDYSIELRHRGRIQRLASYDRLDPDGPPQILWAGDLDRDNRLDVLADLRTSYVGQKYTLFVSSVAGLDSLVARVATFHTMGC